MKNRSTRQLVTGGMIAALYVAATFVSNLAGLASGAIQVRLSEALCVLPCFTASAVPGLFLGCLLANLITGALLPDIIFGSIATLIGALGTRILRRNRYAALLPPVLANSVIVPLVLVYAYELEDSLPFLILTVGTGELISAGLLGSLLYSVIKHNSSLNTMLSRG